jgi:penicillin amidase
MALNRFPTETIHVRGLHAPAEILLDRWGVPHIYAQGEHDAFFCQGFAVARDRLWQIDIWRKRGLGLLAADFGPQYAEADRAARLLLYRGDMESEWACYGEVARPAAEAFVAGINAYLAFVEQHPERLPTEFYRTGTRPSQWDAADCVRIRSHGPLFNFGRELARANVVARFGLKGEAARRRLEPEWVLSVAEGIAAEPVPPEVARAFALATNQPEFAADRSPTSAVEFGGSNNWAVDGARTATGRPVLASDPHRLLFLPSLRYVSHLSSPSLDVIGAGEPGVPGIAIGHNKTSAFCFTIHPADQSDLYVYELHPDDCTQYRYGTEWKQMESITETISVKGHADRFERLYFTRHGPVLFSDPERRRAYAIRSIWSEPGAAPYCASFRYLNAASWGDFVEARGHWKSPPVNHVYADTTGDIGWIMSGSVPIRNEWDGLLPAAGDGSREWSGFMPADEHPRILNPQAGWVATANEMNLPSDFDYRKYKVGFEWPDRSRYSVIADYLRRSEPHRLEDSQRLQTDFSVWPARRLIPVLRTLALRSPEAIRARDLLVGWDGNLASTSNAGLLYEVWFRLHLIEAVSEAMAPGAFCSFDAHDLAHYDTGQVTDLMIAPDFRLGQDPEDVRDKILEGTLANAWLKTQELAGDDPAKWRWGDYHHAQFTHPMSKLLGDSTLNTRRVSKGGSGLTPNAADYRTEDFKMIVGASFRVVLDVGAWDNSVFVNAPGQSGDPLSRHYDDHLEPWSEEKYLPLLFSRERVEQATERRMELLPD